MATRNDLPPQLRLHRPAGSHPADAGEARTPENAGPSASETADSGVGVSVGEAKAGPRSSGGSDVARRFWSVFADATGWRIDSRTRRGGEGEVRLIESSTIEKLGRLTESADDAAANDEAANDAAANGSANPHIDSPSQVASDIRAEERPETLLPKVEASRLARAAGRMAAALREAQTKLVRDQTRSAVAAAQLMASESDESIDAVADRLDTQLADAVAATGTTAAVLMVLDDDTETLSIAATHGLPPSARGSRSKPLRGSRGDLEALVNHVVTVDHFNAGGLDTHHPPQLDGVDPFAGGICVSIRCGEMPIGTLWLLHDAVAAYGHRETAAARMASQLISATLRQVESIGEGGLSTTRPTIHHPDADVDADADADEAVPPPGGASDSQTGDESPAVITFPIQTSRTADHDQVQRASESLGSHQLRSLPMAGRIAPGWHVDGMIESNLPFVDGWHLWDIMPDGTLALAIAEMVRRDGVDHRGYQTHRITPSLATMPPAASMPTVDTALASIVIRSSLQSHLSYADNVQDVLRRVSDTVFQSDDAATPVSVLLARLNVETGEGCFAAAGDIAAIVANRYGYRPLTTGGALPIGTMPGECFQPREFRLLRGDVLLAYDTGFAATGPNQNELGMMLKAAAAENVQHPLGRLRRQCGTTPRCQRGAIAARFSD